MSHCEDGVPESRGPDTRDIKVVLGSHGTLKGSVVTPKDELAKSANISRPEPTDGSTKKSFVFDVSRLNTKGKFPTDLTVHDLIQMKHLLDGSHSNIFKARLKSSREAIIVKTIRQRSLANAIAQQEYRIELELLIRLRHPNIVSLLGTGKFVARNGRERPFLVLEKLEGNTLQYLLQRKTLSSLWSGRVLQYVQCLEYSIQLASALKYLHEDCHPEAVLIHRDLKPDNIAFDSNGILKLIDFGLCTCVPRRYGEPSTYQMTGKTGSLRYMAPEVCLCKPYSEKVDIYSFGMIMYQMLTGLTPYNDMDADAHMKCVCLNDERPDLSLFSKVHDDLTCLISASWNATPNSRPSASELVAKLSQMRDKVENSECCAQCTRTRPEDQKSLL